MKFWMRCVGVLLVIGAIVAVLVSVLSADTDTTDAYITGRLHPISARVTNTVLKLGVDDNQHVRAGDVLLVLDPEDFLVRKQLAVAQIAQGEAQVRAADAQSAVARAAIASALAGYERTRLDLARATELINETPRGISTQEYDAAKASHDAAVAAKDAARAQLDAAGAARAAALAQIATGHANERDADLALGYTKIVAPVDGYVGKRTVEVGARVNAGQTLLSLVADDIWVVANYKETQMKHIVINAPVKIAVDALPGVTLHGTVESFSPASGAQFSLLPPDNATGNFTKVVQRIPVKIRLDSGELARYRGQLMPGMSVVTSVQPEKNAKKTANTGEAPHS